MPRRALTAPTPKLIALAAIHPNAGIRVKYRTRLEALIEAMHRSLAYWLLASYRGHPPVMAQDATPVGAMRAEIRELSDRWTDRFEHAAPELAQWFATAARDRVDGAMREALKRAGFTVNFTFTPAARDAYQAVIAENVSLIKSIAAQHLTAVEGAVMRSVATGRDIGGLAKELRATYGITKRRASTIARHQNGLATAVITRVRQQELGITRARWLHSGGGRHPRPGHVRASRDRLTYDVAKGAFIDGAWIRPGELINCRCVSVSIVPGLE